MTSPRPKRGAAKTPALTPVSPKAVATPKSPRAGVTSPTRGRKPAAAKTPAGKTPATPKSPRECAALSCPPPAAASPPCSLPHCAPPPGPDRGHALPRPQAAP